MSNSLSAVHPELIVEWSDRNLPLTPDSVTFGSNKKVWCARHWSITTSISGNGQTVTADSRFCYSPFSHSTP